MDSDAKPLLRLLLVSGSCLVLGIGFVIAFAHGTLGPSQPTDVTGTLALLGLFLGCSLLIDASRSYLLGVGGLVTCGFVAILLSTYAGLVINASSSVIDPAGVTWHVDHPAVFVAMLGYLAALLLLVSPWSRQRVWIQPLLVAASILLPTVVLLTLASGSFTSPTNVTARLIGDDDPLLLLGLIGIAFVAPIQVAGSVGWVYAWIWGASKLHERLNRSVEVVALSGWALWLVVGVVGALPEPLGGGFHMWSVMRGSGTRAWVLAGLVTVTAGVCAERFHACLERKEGGSASAVTITYVMGSIGLTVGIVVMLLCALMTFTAESLHVVLAVVALLVGLGIATPVVWFARSRKAHPLAIGAGCVTACVTVLAAALAWPTAVNSATLPGVFAGRGIYFFYLAANSKLLIVYGLFMFPLTFAVGAAGFALFARRVLGFSGRWSDTAEYGVACLLVPLAVWLVLGAALLLPSALDRPVQDAFAGWPLPDPSIVAVVASVLAAVLATIHWARTKVPDISERRLVGVIAISGASFVPYLVPAIFRAGGRLALAGLAIQLLATIGILVGRRLPPNLRGRNMRWQLAAITLTIPLLIHAGASAGYTSTYVSGIFAQLGQYNGPGLFSNLRGIIVIPLVVALMLADRHTPRLRTSSRYHSIWRIVEADVLVEWVRENDLKGLSEPIEAHLTALHSEDREKFASWLARALARRYRIPRSRSDARDSPPQASREELNQALDAIAGAHDLETNPKQIMAAENTAKLIVASTKSSPNAPDLWRHLGATMQVSLGSRTDDVCVLTEATVAEIQAAARRYFAQQNRGERQADHARAVYRIHLEELMDALPRTFSLFDPTIVALTPALVLDDPDNRQWIVNEPVARPYRYIALIIAVIAVIAIASYYGVFVSIQLGPHIIHLD